MVDLIRRRPVRFAFLIEAALGAAIVFGVPLTETQIGALIMLVNAALAFTVDSYTTPVADPHDNLGRPLTPDV